MEDQNAFNRIIGKWIDTIDDIHSVRNVNMHFTKLIESKIQKLDENVELSRVYRNLANEKRSEELRENLLHLHCLNLLNENEKLYENHSEIEVEFLSEKLPIKLSIELENGNMISQVLEENDIFSMGRVDCHIFVNSDETLHFFSENNAVWINSDSKSLVEKKSTEVKNMDCFQIGPDKIIIKNLTAYSLEYTLNSEKFTIYHSKMITENVSLKKNENYWWIFNESSKPLWLCCESLQLHEKVFLEPENLIQFNNTLYKISYTY